MSVESQSIAEGGNTMVIESIGPVMNALALLWIFKLGGGGFPTMHSKHMQCPVSDVFSITQQ